MMNIPKPKFPAPKPVEKRVSILKAGAQDKTYYESGEVLFDPVIHVYFDKKGNKVDSTHALMDKLQLTTPYNGDKWYGRRGTAVHRYLELWILLYIEHGLDYVKTVKAHREIMNVWEIEQQDPKMGWQDVDYQKDCASHVKCGLDYLLAALKKGWNIIAAEKQAVGSYEGYIFGGTCDVVMTSPDGKEYLLDWKTGALRKEATYQMCLYSELFKIEHAILISLKDGQVRMLTETEKTDFRKGVQAFINDVPMSEVKAMTDSKHILPAQVANRLAQADSMEKYAKKLRKDIADEIIKQISKFEGAVYENKEDGVKVTFSKVKGSTTVKEVVDIEKLKELVSQDILDQVIATKETVKKDSWRTTVKAPAYQALELKDQAIAIDVKRKEKFEVGASPETSPTNRLECDHVVVESQEIPSHLIPQAEADIPVDDVKVAMKHKIDRILENKGLKAEERFHFWKYIEKTQKKKVESFEIKNFEIAMYASENDADFIISNYQ